MRATFLWLGLGLVVGLAGLSRGENPDPAFFLPGAQSVEVLAGGVRSVRLADGTSAPLLPIAHGGWSVSFSNGRKGEVWHRIGDAYDIIRSEGQGGRVEDRDWRQTRDGWWDGQGRFWQQTRGGHMRIGGATDSNTETPPPRVTRTKVNGRIITRTEEFGRYRHFPLGSKRR